MEAPSSLAWGGFKSAIDGLIKPSLLNFSGPIETVSNLPGRTRFRVAVVKGNSAARATVEENMMRLPGVRSVKVDPVSGSILLSYDAGRITAELLFVALLKILDLEDEFLRPPTSRLAKELQDLGDSLNRTVYHFTGGFTDFWTAAIVALLVLGIASAGRNWAGSLPGGFTMLWWATSSMFRTGPGGPDGVQ